MIEYTFWIGIIIGISIGACVVTLFWVIAVLEIIKRLERRKKELHT